MKKQLIMMALAGGLISCEKFIAEDITEAVPEIILPAVNDTIEANPVHFKWNEVEGATHYHLKVVSPSFSNIQSYELDTLVTDLNFYADLDSNEYEMTLQAINGGYESIVTTARKFWVGVQSTGGSSSTVTLTSPTDAQYVNGTFNNIFQWNALSSAQSYEISIRYGTSFATGSIIETQNNIATTIYTASTYLSEGEYHWGVDAFLTGGGQTLYSTAVLYVDETNPNTALLSTPGDLSFVSAGVVNFQWNNGTDPGTIHAPVNSHLEIASDAGFATVVHSETIQGNSSAVSLVSGVYYWRVTNSDVAGNTAGASTTHQFTIL